MSLTSRILLLTLTLFNFFRNKLELKTLATENKATLELEPIPIKPTKPFFFSKVASYGQDKEMEALDFTTSLAGVAAS